VDLLVEQHTLHQVLAIAFDLDYERLQKCQTITTHLHTRLETLVNEHTKRMVSSG
jgi:hypothetical protein